MLNAKNYAWVSIFLKKLLRISEISQIPNGLCGVYYLYDKNSEMIYIGKSPNLSNLIKTHSRL